MPTWTSRRGAAAGAHRATPEGESAYLAALSVAQRGIWVFSLIYYTVVALIVALVAWSVS